MTKDHNRRVPQPRRSQVPPRRLAEERDLVFVVLVACRTKGGFYRHSRLARQASPLLPQQVGWRVGGREGAGILGVDAVQLRGRASLVHLSRRGQREEVRPEGSDPVRAGEVFPVQALLRLALREPAQGQERPGLEAGAEDQDALWWQREHARAVAREAKGDASRRVHAVVQGAPRSRVEVSYRYASVAGQVLEANSLQASLFGSFWVSGCVEKYPLKAGFPLVRASRKSGFWCCRFSETRCRGSKPSNRPHLALRVTLAGSYHRASLVRVLPQDHQHSLAFPSPERNLGDLAKEY